jgi:hypothetical protein
VVLSVAADSRPGKRALVNHRQHYNLGANIRANYGADIVVLRREDDHLEYESAIEAFANDRDRGTLLKRLLALGLIADQVRWHAAHKGERMVCVAECRPQDDVA